MKYKVLINQVALTHYRVPVFSALAKNSKIDLTIAIGTDNFGTMSARQDVIPHVHTKILTNRWFIGRNFVWQHGLRKLFKSSDVVIMPFNFRILSVLWIIVEGLLYKKKILLWGHSSGRINSILTRYFRWVISRLVSAIIVYSEQERQSIYELGIPQEKIFLARNTIDIANVKHKRVEETNEKCRILFVGRLIPIKKVNLLLEAVAHCDDLFGPQLSLTIIGDGPERVALEFLAKELKIENKVEFLGTVTNEDHLSKYFQSALFACNPAHIGLFAIHSISYGLPVIVADGEQHAPEVEALIPNCNSLFFESGSNIALANTMRYLLENPQELERLTQGALKTSQNYSIEKMVSGFIDAIEYAMSDRKSTTYIKTK